MAGRGVEPDWAITNVPVGHGDILTVWGAQQGHSLKGEEGWSVFYKAQWECADPLLRGSLERRDLESRVGGSSPLKGLMIGRNTIVGASALCLSN